jgi:hypothetical protein
MRVTAGDQKPGESFSHAGGSRLRPMPVEMAQRLTDTAAVINRSGQLSRRASRVVFVSLDVSTLLPTRVA